MIAKYFNNLEGLLEGHYHIVEDYILNKQIFTQEKGTIDGEVFFIDESQLDFLEVVNTNKQAKSKYRYHYMDKSNEMIFRYDNAKHHPRIKTFPHHKHIMTRAVEGCNEPGIEEVLFEIGKHISA